MTTVILGLRRPGLLAPTWALLKVLSGPPVIMSSIVPSLPSYTGRWSLACRLRSSAISSCCCCLFFWAWTWTSGEESCTVHCACWHFTKFYLALSKHLIAFSQLSRLHLGRTLGSCCLASWANNFSLIACSCFFLCSFSSTASCWGDKKARSWQPETVAQMNSSQHASVA